MLGYIGIGMLGGCMSCFMLEWKFWPRTIWTMSFVIGLRLVIDFHK